MENQRKEHPEGEASPRKTGEGTSYGNGYGQGHRDGHGDGNGPGPGYVRLLLDWGIKAWHAARHAGRSLFSMARGRLANHGEALRLTEDMRGAFGHLRPGRIVSGIASLLLLMYLASGVYTVNPGEEAVERLFGRVVKESITEGLHYRLPWPFQEVDQVNVAEIKREGVGLLLPEHRGVHSSPDKIQVLTGDENIVDVQLVIQYRVRDPADYLFNIDYVSCQVVNEAARSAVTRIGGGMKVDEILTVAKEEIQRMVREETQRLLDDYKSGLSVVAVKINKMYPPNEVADAFRDVASAREDGSRSISQAEGYKNSLIPPARGEAEGMIRKAEGYREEVINRAQGETQRFLEMLAEYRKTDGNGNGNVNASSDVTMDRLYLETMEKVLPKVKKYILGSNGEGKMSLRFLDGGNE